ncbi:MAG TPA: hypothetical protein VHZ25_17970 [Acidobacteriaceae bacterium]|jgi:hypothetical protein|nr:hypothetical protein [Acidobacteriaceae bacterium]
MVFSICTACAPSRQPVAATGWTVEPGFSVDGKPAGALAQLRSAGTLLGFQCRYGRLDVFVDPGVQSKPGRRGFPVTYRLDDRDAVVTAHELKGSTRLFIGDGRMAAEFRSAKTLRVTFTPLLDEGPGHVTFDLSGVGAALDQLRAACPADRS